MRVSVLFDLHSYWHAGTGRGSGPDVDAVVFRTPAGLPCLPGRTVKGLLRDAWVRAAWVGALPDVQSGAGSEHSEVPWFGTPIAGGAAREQALEAGRFASQPGALQFSTAALGDSDEEARRWEAWASEPGSTDAVAALFTTFASTRIGSAGVVEPHTLRSIQVAVPMVLRASVTGPDGGAWPAQLRAAAQLILGVGSHRNRGLGRVTVSVKEES